MDTALETAVEAWAPVNLALIELKALQWWEARTGGAVGDPYAPPTYLLTYAASAAEEAAMRPAAWDRCRHALCRPRPQPPAVAAACGRCCPRSLLPAVAAARGRCCLWSLLPARRPPA